ncbi:hypothetical protein P692DRAFT_201890414 [Suillus brevipes Sb2]|nr:hypothetical protein P692DRAFT_201890414 [Suillus brevipes Sb2]
MASRSELSSEHVHQDLQASAGSIHEILYVDAIRFLLTFRNQNHHLVHTIDLTIVAHLHLLVLLHSHKAHALLLHPPVAFVVAQSLTRTNLPALKVAEASHLSSSLAAIYKKDITPSASRPVSPALTATSVVYELDEIVPPLKRAKKIDENAMAKRLKNLEEPQKKVWTNIARRDIA